jgi:hypothetical protein
MVFTQDDIDALSRHPPGPRLLVYLDQSALSRLAEGKYPGLRKVLDDGRIAGRLACPRSAEHEYETALTRNDTMYRAMNDLSEELSLGIQFRDSDEVWRNEVEVAVAIFLGLEAPMEVWEEAFADDPHESLDAIFGPSGFRVALLAGRASWMEEEAQQPKALALQLQKAWDVARASQATFEEQVELEFQHHLRWKLYPLVDPTAYSNWVRVAETDAEAERDAGLDWTRTGSAQSRYGYRLGLGRFALYLLKTYPALASRLADFLASEHVRRIPSLRYPALFQAGLALTRNRNAKPGDLYDLQHLSQGLSRCDVVTGDGGMVQLCRGRGLIPSAVRLFSSREFDDMASYLAGRLDDARAE